MKPIDELVRRAIIGDGTAFTKLWDTYVDALKTYLRSTFSNLDPFFVDDICSRSFEKAFRQIGSFDPGRSRFFTWLKVIAHNTALDTLYQESQSQRNYVHIDYGAEMDIIDTLGDDTADSPLNSIIREEYENQNATVSKGFLQQLLSNRKYAAKILVPLLAPALRYMIICDCSMLGLVTHTPPLVERK